MYTFINLHSIPIVQFSVSQLTAESGRHLSCWEVGLPSVERERIVQDVLEHELVDLEGNAVSLQSFRGRPVLLVFLRWLG